MAALVLGLAGSAIGGSAAVTGALGINAAMGASVGWAIGSMLGGMIGPKQKIEGPRLQDGKVQASTHGQVIPIIYGSYRTAGNIIDFSGMREHAKKERSKKAKSQVTTYSYECDVAVGICEGSIVGVRRIWANNELIYSVAEDADLNTVAASNNAAGNIKIYTGSETQLPDPTLEALHGAGNVPAYRGLAYIVISRIWVEKYGNRLPNFEFEVVGKGAADKVAKQLPGGIYRRSSVLYAEPFNAPLFGAVNEAANAVVTSSVHNITVKQTQVLPYRRIFDKTALAPIPLVISSRQKRRKFLSYEGVDYFEVFSQDSPSDKRTNFCFGQDGMIVACTVHFSHLEKLGGDGKPWYDGARGVFTTLTLFDKLGNYDRLDNPIREISYNLDELNKIPVIEHGVAGLYLNETQFVFSTTPAPLNGYTYPIYSVDIYKDGDAYKFGTMRQIGVFDANNLDFGEFFQYPLGSYDGFKYSFSSKIYQTINGFIYRFSSYQTAPGKLDLHRLDLRKASSGEYVPDITQIDATKFGVYSVTALSVKDGFFVALQSQYGGSFTKHRTIRFAPDGSFVDDPSAWVTVPLNAVPIAQRDGLFVLQTISGAVWTAVLTDAVTRGAASLRSVIADLCEPVGVLPDVSAVPADALVRGYAVSRQISARGAIEPLQNAYFFDAVESDNGLKFIMRGGNPVATIMDEDMMAGIDNPADGDPSTIVRGQEVELPQSVSVSYADWNSDYQISSEMVQRQVTPSVNRVATELPIAMSATQAARIADVWMYQAWSERTQLAFKVGAKHMKLEPTDVIEVQTAGQTFKARITGKTDDRGVIDISAVVDSGRYTSNVTGSSSFGSQTNIDYIAPTMCFIVDTPLLPGAVDDAGVYAFMASAAILNDRVRWSGATLFAEDNGSQNVVGSVGRDGAVIAMLTSPVFTATNQGMINVGARIMVKTNQSELHSVTREQLFNGANLFAIVPEKSGQAHELIQFQFAKDLGNYYYELSGILRGRYGTEHEGLDFGQVAPDGWYLVQVSESNRQLRLPAPLSKIGTSMGMMAVSNGGTYEEGTAIPVSFVGRGLRPYAPVRLHAWRTANNDWHIRWTRRSRVDGGWRESVDVPLGEDFERYCVVSERVMVERFTATPYFVYTEQMQIDDFGDPVEDVHFSVAQVSAATGPGMKAHWKNY